MGEDARDDEVVVERGVAAPGVWRFAHADRMHVVIDAADYFVAVREAMLKARHRIMLIGWDFDTRITISKQPRRRGEPPRRLGDFILWLAKRRPELEIRLLKWNFGAMKLLTRGSSMLDVARWAMQPNIQFKLDSAHPVGCSHHQKIVVIDDAFAVCGGIDMTSDRWDTRDHDDNDARRKQPNGKPYGPWHDATMLLDREAAVALGELGRDRWVTAGGDPMPPCPPPSDDPWPDSIEAEFRDVTVGIARTRAAYEGATEIREVEELFLRQIASAKRFIYAENQYFASRKIADAIAERLREADPPEIVLVNPATADGWLEQKAMDSARAQLVRAIGEHDHAERFTIAIPHTVAGEPIYVHAKLTIIDDRILRIGSANMNNRSLGLDSECDVFIDASAAGNEAAAAIIHAQRIDLLAEHCGTSVEEMERLIEQHGSMRGAILATLDRGGRTLRRLELPELSEDEKALAENAVLDPESADEMFEPFASPGLFQRSKLLRAPD